MESGDSAVGLDNVEGETYRRSSIYQKNQYTQKQEITAVEATDRSRLYIRGTCEKNNHTSPDDARTNNNNCATAQAAAVTPVWAA
jgi:hypothetical protein